MQVAVGLPQRGRLIGPALLSLLAVLSLSVSPVRAQSEAGTESAAIVATARDYIDGWFTSDSARMRRAVHPDLAKRMVRGTDRAPGHQTADMLVRGTARSGGSPDAAPTPADSITIVHREADMALVRIGAPRWVDHLHIARFGDRWQIVNVLWQPRPRE